MRWMCSAGVLALLLSLQVFAQSDRYVVEFSDAGTAGGSVNVDMVSNVNLVRGQSQTKIRDLQCVANSCLRAVPSTTSDPNEGMALSNVKAYLVTASLSTGTFSGGGALELWAFDPVLSTWAYIIGKDQVPTSGRSTITFPVQTLSWAPGKARLAIRPNAVTTSAAAPTLTIVLQACLMPGCAK